ncbi:MAG: hypothetical protein ABSE15_02590 [Candidatus Bathyarchaeia archaeon]|jgi:hypothetical protein
MLFKLDELNNEIALVERVRLGDFGWKEIDLQKLLFKNLDRVIQEEELILIMQSRDWQEEPDLMAIDERGDLWIFELKAWESQQSNILQALRYGQKFGQYDYDDLNKLYSKFREGDLLDAYKKRFPGNNFLQEHFNRNQHFVIITNGLDARTREAIVFWKSKGLSVNPWIYRIYKTKNKELFLEFNTFRTKDDPMEDIEEGYYIVNTNRSNNKADDQDMISNKKVAAYFEPWKFQITRMQAGDKIFLYRLGAGIIAAGIAKGRYKKRNYQDSDKPKDKDQEYYVELKSFVECSKPISASEIVSLTEVNYRFMKTSFSIDKESGEKLWKEANHRNKNQ